MEQVFVHIHVHSIHGLDSWPDATHNCNLKKQKSYICHFIAMVSQTHLWKCHIHNHHVHPTSFPFSVKQPKQLLKRLYQISKSWNR